MAMNIRPELKDNYLMIVNGINKINSLSPDMKDLKKEVNGEVFYHVGFLAKGIKSQEELYSILDSLSFDCSQTNYTNLIRSEISKDYHFFSKMSFGNTKRDDLSREEFRDLQEPLEPFLYSCIKTLAYESSRTDDAINEIILNLYQEIAKEIINRDEVDKLLSMLERNGANKNTLTSLRKAFDKKFPVKEEVKTEEVGFNKQVQLYYDKVSREIKREEMILEEMKKKGKYDYEELYRIKSHFKTMSDEICRVISVTKVTGFERSRLYRLVDELDQKEKKIASFAANIEETSKSFG